MNELRTYLGPYLQCQSSIKTETFTFNQCERCGSQCNSPFCLRCGGEAVAVEEYTNNQAIVYENYYMVVREAMRCVNPEHAGTIDYFIPSVNRNPPREFLLEDRSCALAMDVVTGSAELDWMATVFAAEIEGLTTLYGYTAALQWGLLRWYN